MNIFFLRGSKRGFITRLFMQAITHPKEVLANISSINFKKFLHHLKANDLVTLEEKVDQKLSHINKDKGELFIQNSGYCNCCDREVTFSSKSPWLRDFYICSHCKSIPRERALMFCIEHYYPNWRDLYIHESSPCNRGASLKLQRECNHYIATHYYPDKKTGVKVKGLLNINLEDQDFEDCRFDLVITQDVLEHVFNPEKAFKEIARTLKPGGAHIFTVPLVNKDKPSQRRARLNDGKIEFLAEPVYHGNPVDIKGSLVTVDWGYDICEFIYKASGLFTTIFYIDNLELGIRAEYIEVLVSKKLQHLEYTLP